jgi:translation initiation factor IF-3
MRRKRRPETPNINERLSKHNELRVIDSEGQPLGIISYKQAQEAANDRGVDLVMVSEKARPPVAKLIDWGKYQYEKQKAEKRNKKKTLAQKMLTIRPNIAEHDINIKVNHAKKFINKGHDVMISCLIRYDDKEERARDKVSQIVEGVGDIAEAGVMDRQGAKLNILLRPSK